MPSRPTNITVIEGPLPTCETKISEFACKDLIGATGSRKSPRRGE